MAASLSEKAPDHGSASESEDIHSAPKMSPLKKEPTAGDKIDIEAGAALEMVETEIGDNYRTVGKWGALFALTSNQLGLGVLTLPACLKTLGLVPGLITIVGTGFLAWYTGLEIHQFYCRYPQTINMVDMMRIAGGRVGGIITACGLFVQLVMVCASAAVTISIALNTLSGHSMCTVGFIGISCIACWLISVPRTVKFIAYSGVPCFISIAAAAIIVMAALGHSSPQQAPEGWKPDIVIVASPSLRDAFNAIIKVLFSFAGHLAFPTYMAEMRDPVKEFPFALSGLYIISTILYGIIAVAIYCLAGEYTVSPALGSAPKIAAMVAYGIVIPAILTTGLSNGHIGVKYIYIQAMRWIKATEEATSNTFKSWGMWTLCCSVFWVICFIIANAVPVFDSILSISSATTYAWFGYGTSAVLWFHLNKGKYFAGPKQMLFLTLNTAIVSLALWMNGAGLWSSITELLDIFNSESSSVRGSFDCGNNAIF